MTVTILPSAPPWDLPAHAALLRLAARRGLAPRDGGHGQLYFGEGARLCRVEAHASDRTPFLAAQLCRSRWLTHRALVQAGLPAATGLAAPTVEAAVAAAGHIGWPVVVRPIQSQPPRWPSAPLADPAALAVAFSRLTPGGAFVQVAVPGPVRRLLVIDGHWRPLPPEAAPPHPLDRLLVERAAAVCGIEIAVVELTGADPDRPFTESGARLTALDPGFLAASLLAADPEAAAALYLDHLFPPPADGRIPLVVVVGDEAGSVAEETAAAFAAAGRTVGLATRHGLAVDGLVLMTDDRRGAAGLSLLVDHAAVEAAVVELGPGDPSPAGLGHPAVDVAVLAGAVDGGLAGRLAPFLRRGLVGGAADAAVAAAAVGLAWHPADRPGLAQAAVAAAG